MEKRKFSKATMDALCADVKEIDSQREKIVVPKEAKCADYTVRVNGGTLVLAKDDEFFVLPTEGDHTQTFQLSDGTYSKSTYIDVQLNGVGGSVRLGVSSLARKCKDFKTSYDDSKWIGVLIRGRLNSQIPAILAKRLFRVIDVYVDTREGSDGRPYDAYFYNIEEVSVDVE